MVDAVGSLRFVSGEPARPEPRIGSTRKFVISSLTNKGAQALGFNSSAARSGKLNPKGSGVAANQYHPKHFIESSASLSNRGTATFADGCPRFKERARRRAPGPGDHEIHIPLASRVDHCTALSGANYQQPIASRQKVYNSATNTFGPSKSGTEKRPGPGSHNIRDSTPGAAKGTGVFKSNTVRGGAVGASATPSPGSYMPTMADKKGPVSMVTAMMKSTGPRLKSDSKAFVAPSPDTYRILTSQVQKRSPFGPQQHRDYFPHFRPKYHLARQPPTKPGVPGPGTYDLAAKPQLRKQQSSSVFKSTSQRTELDQTIKRMERVQPLPAPNSYMVRPKPTRINYHYNADRRWV